MSSADAEKPIAPSEKPVEETVSAGLDRPQGLRFVLLTIGLMAVVLVVALDNYIICTSRGDSSICCES